MSAPVDTLVIIPTYNGVNDLRRLIESLHSQTLPFHLHIVDSGSTDGTAELGSEHADRFVSIPTEEFNHGGTRQKMIHGAPGYKTYVFLTQDAYLTHPRSLELLIQPMQNDPEIGAACGRQLPHHDANPLAQHARHFNYPASSSVTRYDPRRLGVKTAFMSNSFAAYRATALRESGGFPTHVILSEDMYVAARMLLKGWKVAYVAEAECRHSHNYTAVEQFRRYFDIGVFHAREFWIQQHFGGAGGEGLRYVKSELSFLGLSGIHCWPVSLAHNILKLLGYKLGKCDAILPKCIKQRLSMHRGFWLSKNESLENR